MAKLKTAGGEMAEQLLDSGADQPTTSPGPWRRRRRRPLRDLHELCERAQDDPPVEAGVRQPPRIQLDAGLYERCIGVLALAWRDPRLAGIEIPAK
ncbi:MAG TPA: hypothetical protein VIO94_10725 [Phenylobacterium sp.]